MAHIPKPFQRPSVDLGGPKKVWTETQFGNLEENDLIMGRGLIKKIRPGKDGFLHLDMASDLVIVEHETTEVTAFVKVAPRG